MTLGKIFLDMALDLLDDEQGITEKAYNGLHFLADKIIDGFTPNEIQIWHRILLTVRCTDGRFYLPVYFRDTISSKSS